MWCAVMRRCMRAWRAPGGWTGTGSLLLGIVLAGLRPVWVRPEPDAATGLPGAVPVAAVETALAAHPGACGAVLPRSPPC